MRTACLGVVAGAALLQQQAHLPQPSQLAWLLALLLPGLLLFRRIPRFLEIRRAGAANAGRLLAVFLLSALAGFLWAALLAHAAMRQQLPVAWEGRDLSVTGTVASLPLQLAQGQRFDFTVEDWQDSALTPQERQNLPQKLSLSWYAMNNGFGMQSQNISPDWQMVQPGQRWQLRVRLKRPHGNANPDGFDYEVWLLEQGIRATGTVRNAAEADGAASPPNRKLQEFVWSAGNLVERSRALLRARMHAALPDAPYAGVIVALVIGDQREIPQSDWTVFNRVGIGHLISISGLHITMVAGMFAWLMSWLWRRSFFLDLVLPLRIPAQKIAALAGALMAVLYVALAGFGVPAQRTMVMLLVVAVAMWNGRITRISSVLCLALAAVVLADPWAVLSPGYWLSFAAVGVIIYAAGSGGEMQEVHGPGGNASDSRRRRWHATLNAAARTQYAVTVGLVPLTMLLFGQISLISPVANAVAIPLISLVVTPMSLLGSIAPAPLSGWLLLAAHGLVQILAGVLGWCSQLPFAVWNAALPSWWIFVLALAGIVWLLAPRGWPMRWLGAVCCLPLLLVPPEPVAQGKMRVTAFDVGQGMALLLETAQHRLLYDTGPFYAPGSDGGSRVILPFLKSHGIHQLDMLMVSHQDSDHSGGALSILQQLPVTLVSSSLREDAPLVLQAKAHRRCISGQSWEWDGVQFEILQPVSASYESSKWKSNARSCTLKVSAPDFSMLLPGDIEATQEDELIHMQPEKLRADVLLAPHHGSGTSSTPAFLRAVSPALAIFQVGYLNRYHHPKPEVFQRYADFGINRLRTDESGAITLEFGASLHVSRFRQAHARYWYDQ
ncbi:DNA internalization-related competence protein ComEC/Rec2 [Undibacterium griseum]|uniref:DNA internalization-related competence protein ComEC/Rec2 n=1 Tax=Undibacterium griseum TaxID=2762295 RepID=A0ABR6YQQ1_9BURK|nr:DNA internalization-related competence protein ComEC/Rec2 [Undibacterium griseum]MBC3886220.1 DNA internalization-related competence protein ComEC/Rec2 [Undibacterium griseum]